MQCSGAKQIACRKPRSSPGCSKFSASIIACYLRKGTTGIQAEKRQRPSGRRSSKSSQMATLSGAGALNAAAGGKTTKPGSNKRPGEVLDRSVAASGSTSASERAEDSSGAATPVPLKYVVREAVKRWFDDTMQEAQRGSVKEMALLGQMYMEGYGVNKDHRAGKEWTDKASARGYRMQGVYCEL